MECVHNVCIAHRYYLRYVWNIYTWVYSADTRQPQEDYTMFKSSQGVLINIPRGPLWGFKDFVEYFRLPGIWRTYSHTYFTCKRYLQRLKRPEYATIYYLIILNKRLFVFYYIIIILLNVLARHSFLNFFFSSNFSSPHN